MNTKNIKVNADRIAVCSRDEIIGRINALADYINNIDYVYEETMLAILGYDIENMNEKNELADAKAEIMALQAEVETLKAMKQETAEDVVENIAEEVFNGSSR